MTASSFWSSTKIVRSVLCALVDPKSTPSGTMTAARPPVWRMPEEEHEKKQLGLLRLDDLAAGLWQWTRNRDFRRRVDWRGSASTPPHRHNRPAPANRGSGCPDSAHAVEQHVHAADAQHRAVKVVAVERAFVESAAGGSILVDGLGYRVLTRYVGSGDKEARRAAGRIANHVLRRRRGHLYHQLDDVPRGAKLPVLAQRLQFCRACTRKGRPWCRCRPCRCRRVDPPRWPVRGASAS